MLRVCHFISGDLWAGAEVMAFNLLRELGTCPDLKVSVLLLNEGRLAEELRGVGLDVQVCQEGVQPFSKILQQARKFVRSRSPHVIHSHRYKENILAYLSCLGQGRTRLVATQHGMPEPQIATSGLAGRVVSRCHRFILSRRFDRVVGVSQNIREFFVHDMGAHPERVRVIHNGLPLPEPPPWSGSLAPLVVGSAGRFFPVKDYPLLVEVARVAGRNGAPIRFELAGDGPERSALERRIGEWGLEDVFSLRGHIEEVSGFYRGLGVYINTSLHEGIPMSILEAMAHGLPVIAPDVGGIGEIIEDGVEGFLVKSRDPQDFAEKCLLLQDSDLRLRMGLAARQKVERCFSAGSMAMEYVSLYRDLVG